MGLTEVEAGDSGQSLGAATPRSGMGARRAWLEVATTALFLAAAAERAGQSCLVFRTPSKRYQLLKAKYYTSYVARKSKVECPKQRSLNTLQQGFSTELAEQRHTGGAGAESGEQLACVIFPPLCDDLSTEAEPPPTPFYPPPSNKVKELAQAAVTAADNAVVDTTNAIGSFGEPTSIAARLFEKLLERCNWDQHPTSSQHLGACAGSANQLETANAATVSASAAFAASQKAVEGGLVDVSTYVAHSASLCLQALAALVSSNDQSKAADFVSEAEDYANVRSPNRL